MNLVNPKIKKLYYSISEVSTITGLKQYVLRYWESEFSHLKPPKNRAGNRTYRQKDIDLIQRIKKLLYKEKYTIDGARKQLDTNPSVEKSEQKETSEKGTKINSEILDQLKRELTDILRIINE